MKYASVFTNRFHSFPWAPVRVGHGFLGGSVGLRIETERVVWRTGRRFIRFPGPSWRS
jgi:hypothetical protein